MKKNSFQLRILPIGGLGEIGMNCMVVETKDDMILIDCGLLFSELVDFGVRFCVPNFQYVIERRHKLRAILLTHGHEDHIGALGFASKLGVRAPIYCSNFTRSLVEHRLGEEGQLGHSQIHTFDERSAINLGSSLKAEFFRVNHSIIDAFGIILHTPLGPIIHSGDFKIDDAPAWGEPLQVRAIRERLTQAPFLLMSDSTNIERKDRSPSEREVGNHLEALLQEAQGLTVVTMFGSNVGRMQQIINAARRQGKVIALSGRSLSQNLEAAIDARFFEHSGSTIIPLEEIGNHPRSSVVILSTGCQGEFASALNRMAWAEHRHVKLGTGDRVIFSSKMIPGNEVPISRLINQLFRTGAEVLYETIDAVHTSGHASHPELKLYYESLQPKYFLPVHGEYRHLVLHRDMAIQSGHAANRALLLENGMCVDFHSTDDARIERVIEDFRLFLEDKSESEALEKDAIKLRRRMGETGAVFVLLARDQVEELYQNEPKILMRGITNANFESSLIDELSTQVENKIRAENKQILAHGVATERFDEVIRVFVRNFLFRSLDRKPFVLVTTLDY